MAALNRRLLARFIEIAAPYWRSEERWHALGMLTLLGALLLGQTAFNVLFNEQTGEFTSALAARDATRFWASIRTTFYLLLVAVPIYACYYFVRDTLSLHWRRWLTDRFLDQYFSRRAFFRLNGRAEIDNPDQRISEDINTFTQQSLYFLMVVLGAVIQLIAFTGVLWSISRLLVGFLALYAIAGTLIATLGFGRPLIALNFRQLRREADFRFGLVRVREHAEPIALHGGEQPESARVRRFFAAAFDNYRHILRWQLNLNLFQYAFAFLTIVLPSAIIASDVLSGRLEVGRATQAAGAFAAVLAALTVIVDRFESLSRFAAGVERLQAFGSALAAEAARGDPRLGAADAGDAAAAEPASTIVTEHARTLALEHLNVYTPDRTRLLVADLNLSVAEGEGLMIVGPSGGGKSSLLRAIAGLWDAGSGRVLRPSPPEILFLPQQPYMALGSLRDQLLYPELARELSDAELQEILQRVNLGDLATRFDGLDAERDWGKVLSVGEQQRLAFARVLIARPRYVVLDEATSALDTGNEDRLYRELAVISTTPISVSHRPALLAYHRQVLTLKGPDDWSVVSAGSYRLSEGELP